MIHKASWNCTKLLFKEASRLLQKGKFLMLYGPFKIDNKHISQSNNLFDSSLKIQNKFWGVRDLGEVSEEATNNGFIKEDRIYMQAYNFSINFREMSL